MEDEKKLHEDLAGLLQRLRVLEQESEENRKKHEKANSAYLESLYSGEKSGFFLAAEMLGNVLFCNDVKREGAEDGKARV